MYTSKKHVAQHIAIKGKPRTHSPRRRMDPRCELYHPNTLNLYRDPLENPLVQPVSVMDHTPGLRADLVQT
ncbi:hypothetical protein [Pseudomonas sp. BIC9C]|uniref:hypothetical protein n=1 Tax=Pseudomonas sp. BIC9C TaxID=3078458 RepID=UPI002AD44CE8|nr:hypothetical protein [Pseudomonas sp. BIC9C]